MKNLKTISIRTSIPLFPRQIDYWRKGITVLAGLEKDLFHNHQTSGEVKHRYPTICFRSEGGRATLFGFGDAAVGDLLALVQEKENQSIQIRERSFPFEITHCNIEKHTLTLSENTEFKYGIFDWLGLNAENYGLWLNTERAADRVLQLENILLANILAFCKSIDWYLPKGSLKLSLLSVSEPQKITFKNNDLLKFEVVFKSNILLPEGIGLGKASAHGFGKMRHLQSSEPLLVKTQPERKQNPLFFKEVLISPI
jgi:hypothetical protein